MTAAILLRNADYSERSACALSGLGHAADDTLLQYLSLLVWERINLTSDYLQRCNAKVGAGKFSRLQTAAHALFYVF